jgi:fatty acid desaturase
MNRFRPAAHFSAEEIRALTARSDVAGIALTAGLWASIAAVFALLARWPNALSFVLAVILLGGRQHALAILGHEAAHGTLARRPWLNRLLGDWLGARLIWQDVPRYREHHLRHHAHTGTEADPDRSLAVPYPRSRRSMRRRLWRDLTGQTGLRRVAAQLLMDIGVLRYTVAAEVERLPRNGRSGWAYAAQGLRNLAGVVLTNLGLFALLWAYGIGWTYWAWVLAYLTTFSLFIRLRAVAEHAGLPQVAEIRHNTRSTAAGLLARLTVAPLQVHYHQEHHLMAAVPCYRLGRLHRLLRARGLVPPAARYREVWQQTTLPSIP